MKQLLSFIRCNWLSLLILAIYVGAFGSYIIEPCPLNIMLVILLSGIACIGLVYKIKNN
jgi:hypothetical protein